MHHDRHIFKSNNNLNGKIADNVKITANVLEWRLEGDGNINEEMR